MAHHIAFTPKGVKPTGYSERRNNFVKLADVDQALCDHLGVECHPTRFYAGWYDVIGDLICWGGSYAYAREKLVGIEERTPDVAESKALALRILDFLEATYDVHTWRTGGFA